jgi:thiosulfate reductase cytochrome b subunit
MPDSDRLPGTPRHAPLVRVTHWITALCFFALLVSGFEIVVSHPRFYWGENGNSLTPALFSLPIPASRDSVPTGYGYTLPDQNGWSRYLHFQAAWGAVATGLIYTLYSLLSGHLRRNLFPARQDLTRHALGAAVAAHLRRGAPDPAGAASYNPLQRIAYLAVVFGLFPLVIWTGLAMSPSFVSAVPASVTLLGGRQTARTIHFFVSLALVSFVLVHLVMVYQAGFRSRVRAMVTGCGGARQEGS